MKKFLFSLATHATFLQLHAQSCLAAAGNAVAATEGNLAVTIDGAPEHTRFFIHLFNTI